MNNELAVGIAAYAHEQRVFVRLLRKRGSFTESEFDQWFVGREWRRPIRMAQLTGDTLMLGVGRNGGTRWAEMLELLQAMMALGIVCAKRDEAGRIVYLLTNAKRNDEPA